ncbi:MAG: hypothetical protein IPH12_15970 [Saprospirales bacterium]|nr:hypothetical protein [Saprospirales bacterium]MBK8920090.1 hypothetical protein [Saprospirales bacterium]
MKEVISSNSLFHFTSKLKYLKAILQEGFCPRYCLENFDTFKFLSGEDSMEMAVPMVCFCDIPLSKVKTHVQMYGSYGVGLSKSWGNQAGISPLFYISPESATTNSIYSTIVYLLNNSRFGWDETLDRQYDRLLRLIRFTKPYEGRFFRRGKFLKSPVTFYNEREWRYIPDITNRSSQILLTSLKPWLDKETFLKMHREKDPEGTPLIQTLNRELQLYFPLMFDVSAVRYLILKTESEVSQLIRALKRQKTLFKPEEIDLIASRIITKRQIFEDF